MRTIEEIVRRTVWGAVITFGIMLHVVAMAAGEPVREASPRQEATVRGAAVPREFTITEAVRLRERGAFILDVRQPVEWEQFHIPGATLIPLDQLPQRLGEVPRDRTVVIVCRTDNRSRKARDILAGAGFRNATFMVGGVTRWKAEGYPIVNGR